MHEIDAPEALRRVAAGSRLIDVREPDEWAAGHAPQATFMPMSTIESHWHEIDADADPAIIVCHSGYRSARVADALERAGVPAVSLAGGMVEWAAAGGPVTTGSDTGADSEPNTPGGSASVG